MTASYPLVPRTTHFPRICITRATSMSGGHWAVLPSESSLRVGIPTLHSALATPHSLDPLFLYHGWYSNYDVTLAITASYPLVPCTTHFLRICNTPAQSVADAPPTINEQRTKPNGPRSTSESKLSNIHPDTIRSVASIAQIGSSCINKTGQGSVPGAAALALAVL